MKVLNFHRACLADDLPGELSGDLPGELSGGLCESEDRDTQNFELSEMTSPTGLAP